MPFHSILFDRPERGQRDQTEAPAFVTDLNLDQVFDTVTAGREEYNLKPFFLIQLIDVEAIAYRHEVFRDLESTVLLSHLRTFAKNMRTMREHLAQAEKLHYEHQKSSWFLDAVDVYCDSVSRLADGLSIAALESQGFLAFREYIASYVASSGFTSLGAETKRLKDDLAAVKYCVDIRGSRVTVSKFDGEPDYSSEVEQTFQKFKQGSAKDYRVGFHEPVDMNHVEDQVVDVVAKLYPDVFHALRAYPLRNRNYLDGRIQGFDREIQFYLAYLEFIERFKPIGLAFCYPEVSNRSKGLRACETFDLALANKLLHEKASVVCNDFYMEGRERLFIVSGPNQGGKTTFARTFGQLHYLAKVGCPVPGSEVRLFLWDRLFTHFEKEERLEDLRGKLKDDLVRIHAILEAASGNSVVIMNESFASTTLKDAMYLGKEVIRRLIQKDLLGVYVTFIDELASLDEATVSMVSTIVPENPALRTYKIVRRPADGLAYAAAIAQKHGLTYESLKRRLGR
ncbi:MAG: MutS-related protein [Candidatus Dormibacteraceae bacterium]